MAGNIRCVLSALSTDMQTSDDNQRVAYYAQQMEAGFQFMEKIRPYPVAECGEPLVSLAEAAGAAGVEVEFSQTPCVNNLERIHRLRSGLIPAFLAAARQMNQLGWVLKVEDGFRTREMQKWLARRPSVFDAILQWTIRELHGEIPSPEFLFRRVTAMIATRPKIGTHMSGSAIDISVWRRDDGTEIDRDGYYPEMSERTPMTSPFASAVGLENRRAITQLMARHGFIAYPFEFWHYNQGDAYAEFLTQSGQPGRYGAVDWNASDNSVTPIPNPDEPLSSLAEIESEIAQALARVR